MIGGSAAYTGTSRQPWRHSGTMMAPPCRFSRNRTLRNGVIFFSFALVILVIGTVMTVLGFTGVTDSGGSMLGMLMMAVAILLFLGSLRQYLKAKKMKATERTPEVPHGTVAASLVIESDETNRTLTVVMDTVTLNTPYDRRSTEGSLPPDYTEATTGSDLYTDCGVVIDANEDPPPPYGPPTYDEAISLEDNYTPQRQYDTVSSQNRGISSHSVHFAEQEGHTNTSVVGDEEESNHPVGYQDLPTVTI